MRIGPLGFEPRFPDPKSGVLPLDEGPAGPANLRAATLLVSGIALLLCAACGKDAAAPPVISTVDVTSPIGGRLAVGRDVQLSAVARTSQGQVVPGAMFVWRASGSAAAVDAGGLVSGLAAGDAPIAATAPGDVTGSITLEVIAADLPGVTAAMTDAFAAALVGALTGTVEAQVTAAIAQCGAGVTAGNFDTIDACLAALRAQAAAATDPTDQVVLASLGLFVDHMERLINP